MDEEKTDDYAEVKEEWEEEEERSGTLKSRIQLGDLNIPMWYFRMTIHKKLDYLNANSLSGRTEKLHNRKVWWDQQFTASVAGLRRRLGLCLDVHGQHL